MKLMKETLTQKIPTWSNFHLGNSHSRSFLPKQFPAEQFLPENCQSGRCPRTDICHLKLVRIMKSITITSTG